jgi:hypothetical protein
VVSATSPFQVVTVADAGSTGVEITTTVTYTTNDDFYAESVTVKNNDSVNSHTVQIGQYADCYLQSSDSGFGAIVGSAAYCTATADTTSLGSEGFVPTSTTTGVTYEEGGFSSVLSDFNAGTLTNSCTSGCGSAIDNGMALSFAATTLAHGDSTTEAFNTSFETALTVASPVEGLTTTNDTQTFNGTLATGPSANQASLMISLTDSAAQSVALGAPNTPPDGTWSVAPASALAAGTYTLSVSESDTSPTPQTTTVTRTFTVEGLTISDPLDTTSTTDTLPLLAGTYDTGSSSGSTVIATLSDSHDVGVPVQAVQYGTDPDVGTWSTAPIDPLPLGSYDLVVEQDSNVVHSHFTVTAPPPGGGGGGGGSPGSTISTTANTSQTAPPPGPPQDQTQVVAPPIAAETGNAEPVSGIVLVRLPGTTTFVPIEQVTSLPVGTLIDARHGTVKLTVSDGLGHLQTGEFSGGLFRFTQRLAPHRKKKLITDIKLAGGAFKSLCGTSSARAHVSSWAGVARRRIVRYLAAKAHGSFNVVGRHASGIERGTDWKTVDTCDATEVHVVQGAVVVTDLIKHKTFVVKAPHDYVARVGEAQRKRR